MQPVRKASENIYSSQSGLKQRKTRIPRCSSPTTLSQNSQLHSLHGGHGCLTNMTSQIHEITNMQFIQVLQLRNHKLTKTQKCRSRSQCNTENHSSSTPISSFADDGNISGDVLARRDRECESHTRTASPQRASFRAAQNSIQFSPEG